MSDSNGKPKEIDLTLATTDELMRELGKRFDVCVAVWQDRKDTINVFHKGYVLHCEGLARYATRCLEIMSMRASGEEKDETER